MKLTNKFKSFLQPMAKSSKSGRVRRRRNLRLETLDQRALLAADFGLQPSIIALDVNSDGSVSASDALSVINLLNEGSNSHLREADRLRRDASGDGRVTAFDALTIINHVNRNGSGRINTQSVLGGRLDRISDAQKENIQQLLTDLSSIRAGSNVQPEQIQQLLTSVAEATENANLPSQESIQQLVNNFQSATDDGELTPIEITGLMFDVQAVLESANVSADDAKQVVDDLRVIVDASGVDREDVQTIVGDIQAIFEEFQNRDRLVSETQVQNIRNLVSDVMAIRADSELSRDQIIELRDDLRTLVQGSTNPDRELVAQLIQDVLAARVDGTIDQTEREQIAAGVDAVLDSANVPQDERDSVLADLANIADASGVTAEDIQVIAEDLQAIREEFQNNRARAGRTPRLAVIQSLRS